MSVSVHSGNFFCICYGLGVYVSRLAVDLYSYNFISSKNDVYDRSKESRIFSRSKVSRIVILATSRFGKVYLQVE